VILADEMGLGKTVQSVALLAVLEREYGMAGPSLVVVPLSTIDAWRREFARWAPQLNVVTYVGDAASRSVIRFHELTGSISVLLTTYELVMRDGAILQKSIRDSFELLLVDEGHRLKGGRGGLLYERLAPMAPGARILLTGTPLQNSLEELWALLHFLMPAKFPDYQAFHLEQSANPAAVTKLHDMLRPHMLRRMKADVERALPGRTERILHVPLSSEQRELYRLLLSKSYKELRVASGKMHGGSLCNVLMELKKVCNHPALLLGGESSRDEGRDGTYSTERSGKLALLDGLLPRLLAGKHRVLIFSQMVRMLDILAGYLQAKGMPFLRLDGGTSSEGRRRAIDAFNRPGSGVDVFLLSTRAGGLGINLSSADTVIIYDSDWNPQNDLQAMARAHRIGQLRPVTVLRLVTRGTVEERVLERAQEKLALDRMVIPQGPAAMGRDELQAILQFGAQAIFRDDAGKGPADAGMAGLVEQVRLLDVEALYRPDAVEESSADGEAKPVVGLLDHFRVPTFHQGPSNPHGWDQIIPAGVREEQMEREQREKEMEVQQALLISSRKRKRAST